MILVTGASGFLGKHLVRYLSAKGQPIRALFHNHPPSASEQLPNVEWVQCDILDLDQLTEALKNVTHIYHCAAIVSFNPKRREQMLHLNVEGTANVVNLALENNVKKIVHISSVAALGRTKETKNEITEEEAWEESDRNSVYGQSKYLSEMEIWRGIAEGLDAVILNPGIILGEGDWNDGSANLFKVVYKEFPFYTKGVNGWVDVTDVVKAMHLLMESDITAERFILNAANYPYREIFNMIADALGKKRPYISAGPIVTSIIARFYMLKNAVFGGSSAITTETARNSQLICHYNNEKLLSFLPGFAYLPIESSIKSVGKAFLNDLNKN